LKAKKNKISLECLIDCFEYIIDKSFQFHYNKDNIISYFYAFTVCQLMDKRAEVLERLLQDLTDENIIHFIKVVSNLEDEFLNAYTFWLIRYIINRNEKLQNINYNSFKYENIININNGYFSFDEAGILYHSHRAILSANINFLKKYNETIKNDMSKYFMCNNYFNMGRVLRRKSDENLLNDYPHYYQLILENDPSMVIYAIRPSENGNFILSKNIVKININTRMTFVNIVRILLLKLCRISGGLILKSLTMDLINRRLINLRNQFAS
jgi:hypothetical protein